jgi:peptidoglycan/xylan/chitin deacetylase (PgdA/CDA1 family)
MRLDRSLTTAIFHPLERAGLSGARARLPILMYHSLSADPENGVAPYYKTNTDPLIFRQQMRYLAAEGYKTMDLTHVIARLQNNRPFPEKTIAITFDDGFKDFYIHGFPALSEHGFTATVFLPTGFIADERRAFKGIECMTWAEVREMKKGGIGFGSHTVNHLELKSLPAKEVERELVQSKAELEQRLEEPMSLFSYPYAFPQGDRSFARMLRSALVQSGYACCLTTEIGRVRPGDDPYRLKRLPANSLDDPALFRAKLEGGYDWLAVPQAIIKKFKRPSTTKNGVAALPVGRPSSN